jgi:branched-chain amino acid transport system substrate-binding protein
MRFLRKMRPWLLTLAMLLLAVALTGLLAACGNDEEEGTATATPARTGTPAGTVAAGGPLKIGMLLDYTGSLAEFGPNIETGAQLAAKQINDAGGVLGKPIQLIKGDSGTNPQVAVEAATRLINVEGVQAIMGSLSSGVTIAVAEGVAVPNKIVMISPASTSPGLTEVKDDDFLFRTVLSDAAQGVVLADWAWEQGYKKVATTYTNNAYGKGLSDQFVKSYEALGGRSRPPSPTSRSRPATFRSSRRRWPASPRSWCA